MTNVLTHIKSRLDDIALVCSMIFMVVMMYVGDVQFEQLVKSFFSFYTVWGTGLAGTPPL